MRILCAVISIMIILLAFISVGSSHGNLSVYSYGSNYIIWNVGGNTLVWLDGSEVEVYGLTYGQYDLQPGTEHIGCNIDGNCTGIFTKQDFWGVFSYWGIYLLMIVMVVASYFVPITAFPAIVYGLYLLNTHLPGIEAGFYDYALVVVLLVAGCVAAIAGWSKVK